MKIIGIVLTIIIHVLLSLSLLSAVWFIPNELGGLKAGLLLLNIFMAGGMSGRYADKFYTWFKSNLK